MDREFILQKLIEKESLFRQKGVAVLGVFGSYARNEAHAKSDIDILIRFRSDVLEKSDPLKLFSELRRLKETLSEEFGKPVDLADVDALDEIGRKYILSELYRVER